MTVKWLVLKTQYPERGDPLGTLSRRRSFAGKEAASAFYDELLKESLDALPDGCWRVVLTLEKWATDPRSGREVREVVLHQQVTERDDGTLRMEELSGVVST